jgi:hypothetical protein
VKPSIFTTAVHFKFHNTFGLFLNFLRKSYSHLYQRLIIITMAPKTVLVSPHFPIPPSNVLKKKIPDHRRKRPPRFPRSRLRSRSRLPSTSRSPSPSSSGANKGRKIHTAVPQEHRNRVRARPAPRGCFQ